MMRLSQFSALTPLAAALLLVACDSGPKAQPSSSPVRSSGIQMPDSSADSTAASAAAAARAVGEIAASGAQMAAVSAGNGVDEEQAPSREAALRAQLLGLNKKKPVEQVEPEQPTPAARPRPKRRVVRAAQPVEPEPPVVFGLSDGQFQDAVGGWRGIQGCIAQNAGHMEDRSGAMRVSFEIASDGSVSDCKVLDTSNAVAAAIAPCVRKKARRIRFPSFEGDNAEKVAKFVF